MTTYDYVVNHMCDGNLHVSVVRGVSEVSVSTELVSLVGPNGVFFAVNTATVLFIAPVPDDDGGGPDDDDETERVPDPDAGSSLN